MRISRRRLLGTAAAGAAAGVTASLLPPSLHAAMAAPMRRGGLDAVEHVIVLMQENRSFDHYYGTLRGVRGFGDRSAPRGRDGRSLFEQPAAGRGPVVPFSLREAAERAGRPGADIQYLGDLDHSFDGSTAAWAGGWNDGWVAAKTAATMTHYERRDIPLQYELADTFTICDAYHCSVFGPTNPNRNYLWTGTTGFEPATGARVVGNDAYDYAHPGYDWTTYPERLQAAGVPWQIYQEWDNFTDNAVEYFVPFKAIGHKLLAAVDGPFRTTEELYDTVNKAAPADRDRLLAQLATGRERLSDAERSLFDRAMFRSEPGSLVARLRADIAAGTLPPVSWLVPPSYDSEHPGASTPLGSANLVHDVLDAIAADPDTWSRTVLLINFDENDGYFDHVPPPVAPRPESGSGDDWYDGRPIGLGPRVPMTIVSPWTVGGHVSSEVFDHTSVLRFLELWTGVEEPNISQWRRTACGDLTSAFDFRRAGRPPRVAEPGPVPPPIERWHPDAPEGTTPTPQEEGDRPARSLPYQPWVRAAGERDGRVALHLGNAGKASAHFAVYPFAGELPEPRHVDVAGEQVELLAAPGDALNVAVQGPGRFWVELTRTASGAAARLDVATRPIARRGGLELVLTSPDRPLTARLRALDHGDRSRTAELRPGRTETVAWPTADGRYDVEVTVEQDPAFRLRVTGRVES